MTMPRCDDCGSNAIDLSANPVPFGDYYHYVAHVILLEVPMEIDSISNNLFIV